MENSLQKSETLKTSYLIWYYVMAEWPILSKKYEIDRLQVSCNWKSSATIWSNSGYYRPNHEDWTSLKRSKWEESFYINSYRLPLPLRTTHQSNQYEIPMTTSSVKCRSRKSNRIQEPLCESDNIYPIAVLIKDTFCVVTKIFLRYESV